MVFRRKLQATTTTNSYTVNQSGIMACKCTRPDVLILLLDEVLKSDLQLHQYLMRPNNLNVPNGAVVIRLIWCDVELDMLNPALPSNYVIKYHLDEGDCFGRKW